MIIKEATLKIIRTRRHGYSYSMSLLNALHTEEDMLSRHFRMLWLREDPASFKGNRQDASGVSKILEWYKIFHVCSNTMLSKLFWKIISTYNSVLIQSITQGRSKKLVLLAIFSKKLDILSFHVALHPYILSLRASQVVLVVKNLPASAGDIRDVDLIPGLGRSPGVGNGNPLQ